MNAVRNLLASLFIMYSAISVQATVRYVDLNSASPIPPYTNWITAATNIQDAVDAALPGDLILVTNGIYQSGGRVAKGGALTNRLVVDKALTIQSVNGPNGTVIQGYQLPTENLGRGTGAIRCAYLTDGASLIGFTITNGATMYAPPASIDDVSAAGVWCDGECVVSNCIFTHNFSSVIGGGARGGTLIDCRLTDNVASSGAGASGSALLRCVVSNNKGSWGGGIRSANATRCILSGNVGDIQGGGAADSTLNGCVLTGNQADGGGGIWQSTANNCLLVSNVARISGAGGGAQWSTLNNCTLVGNSSLGTSGGGGSWASTLNNCIVYYNTAANASNYDGSSILNYCCTTPLPSAGTANITNAPDFIDLINGNFRTQTNTFCLNAGNNSYVTNSTDLDGRPRIVDGTVDMGAYEFQGAGVGEFIGWLQQNNLSTDGSADFTDPDSDGLNNWQEWIAGTAPANALSVLKLYYPITNFPGLSLTWQSVSNRSYFIQRSSDLAAQPAFSTLQSNLVGQVDTTTFTDTTATNGGPYFYRVGVQP